MTDGVSRRRFLTGAVALGAAVVATGAVKVSAAAVAIAAITPQAAGYCRSTTSRMRATSLGECVRTGIPLSWRARCTGFSP